MQDFKRRIRKGSAGTVYLASLKESNVKPAIVAVRMLKPILYRVQRVGNEPPATMSDNPTLHGQPTEKPTATWRSLQREV